MADLALAPQHAKREIREATTWDQLKHNKNFLAFWFMLPAMAFLIFFLAPEADPSVTDAAYLLGVAKDLELPAEDSDSVAALSPGFEAKEVQYLGEEAPRVAEHLRFDDFDFGKHRCCQLDGHAT